MLKLPPFYTDDIELLHLLQDESELSRADHFAWICAALTLLACIAAVVFG